MLDALGDGAGPERRASQAEPPRGLAAGLRALGIRGTLVFTDDRCGLVALRLPALTPAPLPRDREGIGCEFELSPDGTRVGPPRSAWSRDGRELAREAAATVIVTDVERGLSGSFDGFGPAWRPDGSLTVVRDTELVQVTGCRAPDASPCDLVRLSRADLARAARHHLNWPDAPDEGSFLVEDIAWLTPSRAAVLLSVRGRFLSDPQDLVAIFERQTLVETRSYLDDVEALEIAGRLLVAQPHDVLRADGSAVPGTSLTGLRSLAVAPDGRWMAGASVGAVHLVRLAPGPGVRSVDLPIVARDLAWR